MDTYTCLKRLRDKKEFDGHIIEGCLTYTWCTNTKSQTFPVVAAAENSDCKNDQVNFDLVQNLALTRIFHLQKCNR